MDFKELAEERRKVRDLCHKHLPSLLAFKYQNGPSFKLFWDEPEKDTSRVHHLTTSATCIESLRDCHKIFETNSALEKIAKSIGVPEGARAVNELVQAFCSGALARPPEEWLSDRSAPVYCASRTLPLVLDASSSWRNQHKQLVERIYRQLLEEANRFGIGEENVGNKPNPRWYPENAYHTYWALRTLKIVREKFGRRAIAGISRNHQRLREGMLLWAKAKLTEEVSLHWADSAALDSDQLTWALTTFIEFERDLSSNLRGQDLVRKAFDALGATQERVGTWRHYRPLFVYSDAGNAYCYVYESFASLLKAVLKQIEQEEFLEDVVRTFINKLRNLRQYAEMTQVQHPDERGAVGWSSGHRPAQPKTEGWATASVFSFLQAYRRLLGILARREALRALPVPVLAKDDNPLQTLAQRGDTWLPPDGGPSVAESLVTTFVNPIRMKSNSDSSEPDDQPIDEFQARSAILFGPPGASKTRLARAVAAALGWRYVELHSSHFVADGIDAVQRTADRIFAYLMQLDHAVVLFDEPDELVREREGTPDAFGRFLTTSMLPKLAELWQQRRTIYFVATNHISYFDAAIIRSERFDALVPVPLPSFSKKMRKLQEHLEQRTTTTVRVTVTRRAVEKQFKRLEELLDCPEGESDALPAEFQLAKFVLLRWDQLSELAQHLASAASVKPLSVVDAKRLSDALARIADQRLSKLQTYRDYLRDLQYSRRDCRGSLVFSVKDLPGGARPPGAVTRTRSGNWLVCGSGELPERIPGYKLVRTDCPGEVRLRRL